jgi:hypothetical protein
MLSSLSATFAVMKGAIESAFLRFLAVWRPLGFEFRSLNELTGLEGVAPAD